jgi:glycosyltransferase involved in cell wall biosynthesis
MTKIGLIARADNTGLGQQSWEFYRHMQPYKTMIVDLGGRSLSGKDLTIYPDRFDNYAVIDGAPNRNEVMEFLEDLDVVFAMETPYNPDFFKIARSVDVRTVLQFNWEFLPYLQAGPWLDQVPDVLASPSLWHYEEAKTKFGSVCEVVHLPVPIALDRFEHNNDDIVPSKATQFLHVVGHEAVHDRNGTKDFCAALEYVESDIEVTIRTQAKYIDDLVWDLNHRDNVLVEIHGSGMENYWDLYQGQHVLVMPRRYGGLCLPVNEALGSLMPVVMPNIEPNNLWLPPEWLVTAARLETFSAKSPIDVHTSSPEFIAHKIDEFASGDLYQRGVFQAAKLAEERSWEHLKPLYDTVLDSGA